MKKTPLLRILFFQFILLFFCFPHVHATEIQTPLKFGAINNIPPYSYEENGIAKGFSVEIVKEVFSRLGLKLEIEFNPWARLQHRLKKGYFHGVVGSTCGGRNSFLNKTEPYYNATVSIFTHKNSYSTFVSTLNDLKMSNVGKVRHTSYLQVKERDRSFNIIGFRDDTLLFNNLTANRIDHAVIEDLPIDFLCENNDICRNIKKSFTLYDNPICMRLSTIKKGFDEEILTKKVNKIVIDLKKEGFIDKLFRTYFIQKFKQQGSLHKRISKL